MKRRAFLKYLNSFDCVLHHEGANHSIIINNVLGIKTTLPRHTDIHEDLCKDICNQLRIPKIGK
jgi:hypothetical protein